MDGGAGPGFREFPKSLLQKMKVDPSVETSITSKGMIVWCASNPRWHGVLMNLSIAAGPASDSPKHRGQARFLARLLETRLNLPKNPAQTLLPAGQGRYHVTLQKEWLQIHASLPKGGLREALLHLSERLAEAPTHGLPDTIVHDLRKELLASSGRFPALSAAERIDSFLYVNHPRGRFLRGRATAFQALRSEDLNAAHPKLYRAERMRLLLLGALDCGGLFSLAQDAFAKLPGTPKPLLRPFPGPGRLENAPRGRLFLPQEIFSLYLLPPLQREDAIPLEMTLSIAQEEIALALRKRFGEAVPFSSLAQPFEEGGYLLFSLPNPPTLRSEITKILRENLGKLLMSPYNPPMLESRILILRDEYQRHLQDATASIVKQKELLLAQLLLPSETNVAYEPLSVIRSIKPSTFRLLARRYLASPVPLVQSIQPFSLQRIVLFIGSLLALWFFLDLMIRRTRREDG